MYNGTLAGKGTPTLQMQRLFPHVLLSKSKEKIKEDETDTSMTQLKQILDSMETTLGQA